jgi:uncharacterized DUF497 family protein
MSDFDPAKETVNLAKHRISLARWVDLEVFAIVRDDRFDYGEPRYRAWTGCRIASSSPYGIVRTDRSVYGVLVPRS